MQDSFCRANCIIAHPAELLGGPCPSDTQYSAPWDIIAEKALSVCFACIHTARSRTASWWWTVVENYVSDGFASSQRLTTISVGTGCL